MTVQELARRLSGSWIRGLLHTRICRVSDNSASGVKGVPARNGMIGPVLSTLDHVVGKWMNKHRIVDGLCGAEGDIEFQIQGIRHFHEGLQGKIGIPVQ